MVQDKKLAIYKSIKTFSNKMEILNRYFRIIAIITGTKLTKKELGLLSHIAIKGTISSISSRKEFVTLYNTSIAVINNTISKLYKKRLLVKTDGKIRINPLINLDFVNNDTFIFAIKCLYKETELKSS